MNAAPLRILSGGIAVRALPIVKDAKRVPITSALTENTRIIHVIAMLIAQETNAAVGADARTPRSHTISKSLRHCQVRTIGPAIVRIFPSGTIRIVARTLEQHSKSIRIR